jgi:hypothetical protein
VKIRITFDFDDRVRRAIAHQIGVDRPATREECQRWIDSTIDTTLMDLCVEYDDAKDDDS